MDDRKMEETVADETTIVVNGKPTTVAASTSVASFLTGKGLPAKLVIVERNGEILNRSAYETTLLQPGDRLEVVHAVGGG